MEKRALALTWWKGQRETQKTDLTKKHFPFANHRYLDAKQIETLYEKESVILPNVNLNNYKLTELLNSQP